MICAKHALGFSKFPANTMTKDLMAPFYATATISLNTWQATGASSRVLHLLGHWQGLFSQLNLRWSRLGYLACRTLSKRRHKAAADRAIMSAKLGKESALGSVKKTVRRDTGTFLRLCLLLFWAYPTARLLVYLLFFNLKWSSRMVVHTTMRATFALSESILQAQLEKITANPYLSILMDSSANVTTSDCVLLYVLYLVITESSVRVATEFLCILPLSCDKSGQDMYDLICRAFRVMGLNLSKIVGVCTDGGSEYTGKDSGVIALFRKARNSCLVAMHCVAHRLRYP
jgi:hypothetical protein